MTERSEGQPRRSFGGAVVENSLRQVGFDLTTGDRLALVEVAHPQRTPFGTVLAQNAWNVVPLSEFWVRLRDYPARMWPRFAARRALAGVNLRRAERVVCLTQAMAELCAAFNRRVEVAPVTVPVDFTSAYVGGEPLSSGTLLVPGTLTWYKNPVAALDLFDASDGAWRRVLYAGRDDGSGCWTAVRSEAARRGISIERQVLDRESMRAACASADAVVVGSKLESLSFSLAESLLLARHVHASRIPAHTEVAERLGRRPVWLGEDSHADPQRAWPTAADQDFVLPWMVLGEKLGLARDGASAGGVR